MQPLDFAANKLAWKRPQKACGATTNKMGQANDEALRTTMEMDGMRESCIAFGGLALSEVPGEMTNHGKDGDIKGSKACSSQHTDGCLLLLCYIEQLDCS